MFWFPFSHPRKIMWGLFWILLGLFLLLSNHGLLGYRFSLCRDWPIVLIALGVMMIVDVLAGRNSRSSFNNRWERGGNKQSRAQILREVEEGRISAEEAAEKLKGS